MLSWNRLRGALSRTSHALSKGVTSLLSRPHLDAETLSSLEDLLLTADLGPQGAAAVLSSLKEHLPAEPTLQAAQEALVTAIASLLEPYERPLESLAQLPRNQPVALLLMGVNGNGKTTTAAKIAYFLKERGRSVRLAACDTFRAAACEQLCHWGEKLSIPVCTARPGADSAALAYSALESTAPGEILLVDTAGRLHTRGDLMAELSKIRRVLGKVCPEAPQETLLVLDATTGQEALAQAAAFQQCAGISGMIVTKLDGTAKSGIIVPLVQEYSVPLLAIGTGESLEALSPFCARAFAEALVLSA
ncbi:MAG: signal recognition particle-docking protein FtsY [Holosporales bacterium]|jgi:fused signal recognition particle receptor|nr:signal recognition particle-docking protein FtsY [Holosporales bacterium]